MGLKSNLHKLKEKYKGTKMAPAFNAIHTFLYLPNETTHSGGTHIKAADDLKRTMNTVIMAMVPWKLIERPLRLLSIENSHSNVIVAVGVPSTESSG